MTLGKYISAVYAATTHNGHSDNHYKNAYANVYIYTVYVYGLLETYVHIYQVYNCRTFIPIYSLVYAGTYAYIQVFFMTYHYFVVNLAIYTSVSAGSC